MNVPAGIYDVWQKPLYSDDLSYVLNRKITPAWAKKNGLQFLMAGNNYDYSKYFILPAELYDWLKVNPKFHDCLPRLDQRARVYLLQGDKQPRHTIALEGLEGLKRLAKGKPVALEN